MTYSTHAVTFLRDATAAAQAGDWARAGALLRTAEREIDGAAMSASRRPASNQKDPRRDTVNTRLEYLLYVLAKNDPNLLTEAEQFTPAMLTSDMGAGYRARKLAAEFATEHTEKRDAGDC